MKLAIIGSGVVGQATGVGLAMFGNEVVFHDVQKEKLNALRKRGFKVSSEIQEAIHDCDVLFLCVPTPTKLGQMDFSFLKNKIVEVAKVLDSASKYTVVVVRSTVLPGTTRIKVVPLLERFSKLKLGVDFGVCMNPEFLREKTSLSDFLHPTRIVIGENDRQSGDILEKLYSPLKAPVFRTNFDTAEMIKYVSNAFLSTKISFFNEIHRVCQTLGVNSELVSQVVSEDPRIGKYGVYGGRPFDGSCLPKDLEAFVGFVKEKGLDPKMLNAANLTNLEMHKLANLEMMRLTPLEIQKKCLLTEVT